MPSALSSVCLRGLVVRTAHYSLTKSIFSTAKIHWKSMNILITSIFSNLIIKIIRFYSKYFLNHFENNIKYNFQILFHLFLKDLELFVRKYIHIFQILFNSFPQFLKYFPHNIQYIFQILFNLFIMDFELFVK